MKEIINGVVGGFLVISLFLLIIFNTNLFNYEVKILVGKNADSLENYTDKVKLIKELQGNGIIVTPQEYTNNIVNYYNTALTIVLAILILFSIMSYIQLRFISRRQIEEVFKDSLKDSKEFDQFVSEAIFGKAEERFVKIGDIGDKLAEIEDLRDRLEQMESDLESFKNETDQLSKEK